MLILQSNRNLLQRTPLKVKTIMNCKSCAPKTFVKLSVLHNLSNKFQPLYNNKSAVFHFYKVRPKVSKQLKAGKTAANANLSLQFSVTEPLHACKVDCWST